MNSDPNAESLIHERIATHLVFRNFSLNPALRELIFRRLIALEKAYGRILRCSISVGIPQRRHRRGRLYNVRLALHFPRGKVVTTRSRLVDASRPALEVAIHEAFLAARKQLRTQVERRRGREPSARGIGLRGLSAATRDRVGTGDSTWRRAPRGTRLGTRAESEQEAEKQARIRQKRREVKSKG